MAKKVSSLQTTYLDFIKTSKGMVLKYRSVCKRHK